LCSAAAIPIGGIAVGLGSEPHNGEGAEIALAPSAQAEIASVEAEIDHIEAGALVNNRSRSPDSPEQLILLGKLLFYDANLSVDRNEACALRHRLETGFTGPVGALNQTTVAYPGSIRTRFCRKSSTDAERPDSGQGSRCPAD
jgi:cytochrome c peroxidase